MSRYALCVGIDDYDNLPDDFPSLEFASSDARKIAEILTDNTFDRVDLLTRPHQTTLSGIIEALKKLFYDVKPTAEDSVLLYFSGHCGIDSQDRLYLIPSDGRVNHWGVADMATVLRLESLGAYMASCPSHNQVLLLDLAFQTDPNTLSRPIKLYDDPNFFTLGSAASPEIIERFSNYGHGLFTLCLLKALEQVLPQNGLFYFSQLCEDVRNKLYELLGKDWQVRGQFIQADSLFHEDVPVMRYLPSSAKFYRQVKKLLQRTGYRLLSTGMLDGDSVYLRADITVAFTRSVVEVLAVDNSRSDWTYEEAVKFQKRVETYRQSGEITHGLIITYRDLSPELQEMLRLWRFGYITFSEALARA